MDIREIDQDEMTPAARSSAICSEGQHAEKPTRLRNEDLLEAVSQAVLRTIEGGIRVTCGGIGVL